MKLALVIIGYVSCQSQLNRLNTTKMSLEDLLLKCRLCQAEKGTIEITSNAELVNKIFECTRIKVRNLVQYLYYLHF